MKSHAWKTQYSKNNTLHAKNAGCVRTYGKIKKVRDEIVAVQCYGHHVFTCRPSDVEDLGDGTIRIMHKIYKRTKSLRDAQQKWSLKHSKERRTTT